MIKISIICVGKLKEKYWREAIAEYSKRMGRYADFTITEVDEEKLPDSPSQSQVENTLQKEGERILARIPKGASVAAMCIEGKQYSSEKLAALLEKSMSYDSGSIAFIIGGSWGLSDDVKKAADIRMSMSEMTFPHQLARVMLCEQIYRSCTIIAHAKYHK